MDSITIATRAQLLMQLKGCGYNGPADLKQVKAWIRENAEIIGLDESDVDLDTLWKNNPKLKAVTLDVMGGTLTVEEQAGAEGAAAVPPEEEDEPQPMRALAAGERKDAARFAASKTGKVNAAMHNGGLRKGGASWQERLYEKQIKRGRAEYSTPEEASAIGAYMRLKAMEHREYAQRQADTDILSHHGIDVKTSIGSQNSSGGALIEDVFQATMIDLRERWGGVTALAQNRSMTGPEETHPRQTGDLTVYTPGEGQAITESNPTFDNVTLHAKKRATLTKVSSELLKDAAVSIADVISRNIAWSFEKDLENAFVSGDGTSTYFGVMGLRESLLDLSATRANIAGLVVGTGNLYSELTLPDFEAVQARLPEYESQSGEPMWLMHPRFFRGVFVPLLNGLEGATKTEVNGKTMSVALGAPVVFSNAMPRTQANDQVCALYGWFDLAAMVGRVNGSMEVATSVDRYFEEDVWAIRGTHRAAVTVHDVGNQSATESLREPGPVVGLLTAAS